MLKAITGMPIWVWAIALLIGLLGVQHLRVSTLKSEVAKLEQSIETEKARALKEKTDIENDWRTKNEKLTEDFAAERGRYLGDLADASLAADGLRGALSKYARTAVRSCPASPGTTVETGDPIGVLADMSARSDKAAEIYARTADERGSTGRECEARYDTLVSPK